MAILTKPQPSIAIVGAGLGGLALALSLQRAAITSQITVFELRPRQAHDGGYLALAPNALYQLDQLGLYQTLLTQGYAYEELFFLSGRGSSMSRIGSVLNGSLDKYGYPALRISRHIVRQTLLAAVEQDPSIELKFNKKLIDISESTDYNDCEEKVLLSFEDGSNDAFDYVVGADGIHSRVRKMISEVEPTFAGQMGIGGCQLPRSSLSANQPLPCMFMGRTNGFMMMPTVSDGSRVSAFATVEIEARSREAWAELAADKVEQARILQERHCGAGSEWPQVVQQACESTSESEMQDSLTIWPFFNAPELKSYITASSRVIMLGDAAHAMPPTGGQGAAMAFEDAASLARVFAKVSSSDSGDVSLDLAAALQKWQDQRQKRCKQVKAFTSKSGDMRRATPSLLLQIIKEWAMWLYFLIKGKDGGLAWVYGHREKGPHAFMKDKLVE